MVPLARPAHVYLYPVSLAHAALVRRMSSVILWAVVVVVSRHLPDPAYCSCALPCAHALYPFPSPPHACPFDVPVIPVIPAHQPPTQSLGALIPSPYARLLPAYARRPMPSHPHEPIFALPGSLLPSCARYNSLRSRAAAPGRSCLREVIRPALCECIVDTSMLIFPQLRVVLSRRLPTPSIQFHQFYYDVPCDLPCASTARTAQCPTFAGLSLGRSVSHRDLRALVWAAGCRVHCCTSDRCRAVPRPLCYAD
ncbi:hypothetical protein HYPSUDRAFT_46723 [Hypholoma sublateritium FD-334 SS-4]|uniref:Uncharacterized protein n=1 Tax=Hypholoma sublateritium (strain FD-334 SS-4) TaxID=945553 RepID=A0A0D2KR30_HYPSF|nr:hypothetical protein HYPSUDRAFT_46723 [Hypholoma sublateritium FD-334 SS-4]